MVTLSSALGGDTPTRDTPERFTGYFLSSFGQVGSVTPPEPIAVVHARREVLGHHTFTVADQSAERTEVIADHPRDALAASHKVVRFPPGQSFTPQ